MSGQSCWLLIQAALSSSLRSAHLLAQRLDVVAADRGRHHVGLGLLHLEQIGGEVARVLRDQQVVDDLPAGLLHLLLGRRRGGVAPDVVVGEQQPLLADLLDRVLHGGLGEVGAVAVQHELDARAVLAGLAGRRGVRVEIDGAVLVGDLGDGVGDARSAARRSGTPHWSCAMKRSATRVPVAGLVSVSAVIHSILRPITPPLALNSSIGHADAAQVVLAAVAVLAAGIAGQAELDRLGALRPDPVVRPGAEERAGAAQRRPPSGCPS